MEDRNLVVIVGRLVMDPEITSSSTGKIKAKFRIAVNRRSKDEAYFFNCQAFGKTAEVIKNYATKGRRVDIQGKLSQWNYSSDDGQNRTYNYIYVERINFLDKPPERNRTQEQPQEKQAEDDLPF